MIVTKFGGTSLSTAAQIKKACAILLEDSRRQIMVVSAPGCRYDGDKKTTDLLILLAKAAYMRQACKAQLKDVLERFSDITDELNLPDWVFHAVKEDIEARVKRMDLSFERYLDLVKAAGEDSCAKVVAAYLQSLGADAAYLNPQTTGMVLEGKAGGAHFLPAQSHKLSELKHLKGIGVYPGFFGYTRGGDVVTFGRGGSDITAAILAAAVDAEIYENFTDVDSVYAANPKQVKNPRPVPEITYREMRELAYAGFSVLHEESVEPVLRAGIPLCIKNIYNPAAAGTTVLHKREGAVRVVGIAGTDGFCILTVGKYLMNHEVGFGRKLFGLLEEESISFDHVLSGIDTMSVIFRQEQLSDKGRERLFARVREELNADFTDLISSTAIIMLVGEGIIFLKDIVARLTSALLKENIYIDALNMCGGNPVSMAIGVKSVHLTAAVQALYGEFFG